MKTEEQRKAEFFDLLRRYVQLGALLPQDVEDGKALTDAKVVLAEMEAVKVEIDAMLERERALRQQ